MEQRAFDNIGNLLDLNDKSVILFNENKEITLVEDSNNEHITNNFIAEYSLYFTFNQIFNMLRKNSYNKRGIISDLNDVIDKLYENDYFLKFIDDNKSLEDTMNDICIKLDVITERFLNKCTCNQVMRDMFEYLLVEFRENIPKF